MNNSKMNTKILLVDDEPLILELIADLIQDEVDEVFTAENGKVALEIIIKTPDIDCVVCDLRMPVMDGVQTIKSVRDLNIDVPFIFYSGNGDQKTINELTQYGIFDFLDKPRLAKLLSTVRTGLKDGFVNKMLPLDSR